eukprot:TRINITY_DN304_c1_g1_i3.p1 TRINITY_DN304_c1_g1~~TRINITY_DN304_c1_g1_i3.p1  ORF type:complete len:223 (+),score=78.14 TRINITY_DN304_c1_g1_i3:68-736(+)
MSAVPSPPPAAPLDGKTPMAALNLNITAMPAVKAERLHGAVKSFNTTSGFGFIECEEVQRRYHRDVFLHKAQAGEVSVGTKVEFSIDINSKGMPQARDVKLMEEVASMKFKKPLPPPRSRQTEMQPPDLDSSCVSEASTPVTPISSPRDKDSPVSNSSAPVSFVQQQPVSFHQQANLQQQQLIFMQMQQQLSVGMVQQQQQQQQQQQVLLCPVICHVPVMMQ